MPRIEWIGVRLPSMDPIVSFDKLTGKLSRKQLEAVDEVDAAIIALVRNDGNTEFGLGPKDGFSRSYLWCWQNRYIETMTESDARILFRLPERLHFKNLDDPNHAKRVATYPEPNYIAGLMAVRHGTLVRPGNLKASVVARLLRQARAREREGQQQQMLGRRTARWGPKP